ncbi:MAG: PAS domain S-box protein, partial [Myxococcales bacterium]|nr:PAS domain S-box protein [Myxococcales bacterium]
MLGGHGELDHLFHALWGILASAGLASVGVAYESPERRLELAFRYLASVCFGLLCFALIGFQILSGPSWRGLFGIPEAGLSGDFGTDVFIRHAAAVGLAAAVLTGALGSRPPFAGHMLLIFIQASILYPVVGHWMWATGADGAPAGWLGALGVVDRGGAAPVHVVAAAAAAAVAMRQGRDPDERSEAGGSRVALAASAVLLWIGWLGVSAVSPPGSPARSGDLVAAAANLSAAALFGAFVTYGLDTQAQRPCLLRALIRGGIAGLVAASAALTDVDLGGSALLGAGAGVVSQIVFRMRRVENPHGPIGVVEAHLVPALWGLVAVALLSRAGPMDVAQRWALLRAQTLAAGVTAAWSFTVTSVVVLLCERWLIRPRDRRSAELAGLEALRGSGGGALAPPSSAGSAAIAIEPSPASPELDPSDERARLIVENAFDAVITMDARGRIIAWNAKAEEVFGWLRHEVVGRPATHVVVPETSRARLTKRITSLAAPGFPGASQEWTDLTLVRRSGVEFPAEMAVILLRRDDTHEYCAFVRDRGEMRRDADEKEAIGIISQLFLAADSLEGIYHELPNVLRTHFGFPIVAIETCDSVMLRMACVASTGLDAAALPLLRLPADMTLSGHVATTGRAVVDTQVARRPAHQLGILRDARVSALLCVPMKTRAEVFGTITVADTVARDIPSSVCESMQIIANYLAQTIIRRRTEDRLRGQRHEQQVIFDSVPAMIWYKDRENRILRANRPAAAAFGLDLGQLEGKTTAELFPANAIEHYREDLEVIRSGAPKFGLIEEIFLPTGQLRWLKMDKIPYVNADGEVIGVIVFAVDVTEQKRTERELAEARDMALESARLKSQFLANISHEIRTPLNGVIGMTELVLDSDIDAEQREHLGIALNSARSLLSLLTDILDFAKIEAGKLDLRSVAFDPRTAIAGLMKGLAAKAHEKRLELAFDVASDVPPLVAGDPDRLRQVILNLVDNAIKFTNEGEVVLRVDVESRDDEGFVLHVAVRDTGIGMDEDARARIFDAFWQADGTSTRRFGGTGLGLGIVSELVSRMGGRVWVDSRPGEGSTFHFTVRLAEAKTPEAPAELDRAPTLVGRRALVIV